MSDAAAGTDAAAGWRPWRAAWSDALYGASGFYRRSEGPAGHFETSASAGGGVVEEFARALWRLAGEHGCSTIVDVGAGRGGLLRALAASPGRPAGRPAATTSLVGVDIVDRPSGLPDEIAWLTAPGGAALPERLRGLEQTLVIANEWLDVIPLDIVEVDPAGRLRLVEVDPAGNERLGPEPDASVREWCARWWPIAESAPGTRAEAGGARDLAFADLVSRVRSGLCVAIDYGHTSADRPPAGSLAAHRDGRLVPPVPDGSCDLTAHVALDSLGAERLLDQRTALADLGVDSTLGPPPAQGSDGPDPSAYLTGLQRSGAAGVLLDRGGLGGFGWAVSVVAIGQSDRPPARLDR